MDAADHRVCPSGKVALLRNTLSSCSSGRQLGLCSGTAYFTHLAANCRMLPPSTAVRKALQVLRSICKSLRCIDGNSWVSSKSSTPGSRCRGVILKGSQKRML